MKIIKIPFDGFYCSITDQFTDSEIANETEYREQEGLPLVKDFDVDFNGLARKYVIYLQQWLESEHDLKLDSLAFESMVSPREYNFTTDVIYCEISDEDIKKLFTFGNTENLQSKIDDIFKSRSGFISFYGDFVNEWKDKPILEWDYNELSVLFPEVEYFDLWESAASNGVFLEFIDFKYEEEENE